MFQTLWKDSERRTTWIVLLLLIIVAILSIALSGYAHIRSGNTNYWEWLDSAAQNFSTEMLGAILTFALFELILGSQKEKYELQKRLVLEAGSQSNETAKAAVERLRAEGWLTKNGSIFLLKNADLANAKLQGAELHSANLQKASLVGANLQGAHLRYANLQKASLVGANLQGAYLEQANLQAAHLWQANLQQADLEEANLQRAYLEEANLEGVNLARANLQKAYLEKANLQQANLQQANLREVEGVEAAIFDEKTVLPDATSLRDEDDNFLRDEKGNRIYDKYWTPQTDMRRYTDPEHPDFWEPYYLKLDYDGYFKLWWVERQAEDWRVQPLNMLQFLYTWR